MKKNRLLLPAIAVSAIFALALFYGLIFFALTEKNYNKIMCYYIARSVTRDSPRFEDKITSLRDFVHENVRPVTGYDNRLDTVAIDKLLSGIGWCDQQARVFMSLASPLGIRTRLLFLRQESGPSPHAVAEALSPDNRWVIVDAAYGLDLSNREGRFASQSDIRDDPAVLSDNIRVRSRAPFETRWADSAYLSVYSNPPSYIVTKKGMAFDPLKGAPLSFIRPFANIIQDVYLEKKRHEVKDIYEFRMLKARGWQLLSYYKESEALYRGIIANSPDPLLRRKAEYYLALSLKEEKRYEEVLKFLTDTINSQEGNPYLQYLYGLRAVVLEKMGRHEEASRDLLKIEYSLDASNII